MELHNCRRISRMICCRSFRFRAKAFRKERVPEWRRLWGGEDFGVIKSSEWRNVEKCHRDGRRIVPGKPDVVEPSAWILIVVDISGEPLDSLNTCHHPGANQILITTRYKVLRPNQAWIDQHISRMGAWMNWSIIILTSVSIQWLGTWIYV